MLYSNDITSTLPLSRSVGRMHLLAVYMYVAVNHQNTINIPLFCAYHTRCTMLTLFCNCYDFLPLLMKKLVHALLSTLARDFCTAVSFVTYNKIKIIIIYMY